MSRTLKITSVNIADGVQHVLGTISDGQVIGCKFAKWEMLPVSPTDFDETAIAEWEAANDLSLNHESFRTFLKSIYGA